MSKNVNEQANEYAQYPEIVSRLTALLEKYVAEGRSTPGAKQQNDAPIEIHKREAKKEAPEGGKKKKNK